MKEFKQNKYKYEDAGRIFLYSILMPQIIGIIFMVLIAFIANIFNTTYSIAVENVITKSASLFLAQIGFLIVFFSYQYAKKINWIKATKITKKINIKQVIVLILIATASLFLFSPLINLVDHLVSLTGYSASSELPINLNSVGGFIIGVVALAIFPAICEELVFRGIIYQGFIKKFGYKKAVLFSALLFALMHTSIQQTVYQVIIGVMLAYVFYITGSLLAPILLHFVNNFSVIMLNVIIGGTQTPAEPMFTSFNDYVQVFIFTAFGAYIIWNLFELLKKVSKKEMAKDEYIEQLDEAEQYLEQPPTIQTLEGQAPPVWQMPEQQDRKYKKMLIIAISIGIVFWVLDFIMYVF